MEPRKILRSGWLLRRGSLDCLIEYGASAPVCLSIGAPTVDFVEGLEEQRWKHYYMVQKRRFNDSVNVKFKGGCGVWFNRN